MFRNNITEPTLCVFRHVVRDARDRERTIHRAISRIQLGFNNSLYVFWQRYMLENISIFLKDQRRNRKNLLWKKTHIQKQTKKQIKKTQKNPPNQSAGSFSEQGLAANGEYRPRPTPSLTSKWMFCSAEQVNKCITVLRKEIHTSKLDFIFKFVLSVLKASDIFRLLKDYKRHGKWKNTILTMPLKRWFHHIT